MTYNNAMSETSLDSDESYQRLDPSDLRSRIMGLPGQIDEAWAAASALAMPDGYRDARNIVVIGMGGSGIGGALLERLLVDLGAPARVRVVRGYRLPADIGKQALVIASSNSGDTEETVASFGQAIERGAMCIAIAAGGRLAAMAREADAPCLRVNWTAEPRAALGWSFAAPLAISCKLGLVTGIDAMLTGALEEMRSFAQEIGPDAAENHNIAKQVARRLSGRMPIFVGAESFAPVAYRWRTQVNENAKSWAIADELPEMNHNAPVGYGLPQRIVPLLHAVLLRHASVHPRIALRFEATRDQMLRAGVSAEIVDVEGRTLLAQVFRGVMLGDLVSYYLGLLNGMDPSPIDALVELKEFLASRE